jgi:signal transduction histidine kinase
VELLLSEPQTKYEYAEPLMRNATRLQKIISNILDISKIDNDMLMLNIERFNLTKTILQVVEDTRTQIIRENKDASIIYDPNGLRRGGKEKEEDIFIDGNKERISQVISNILDNAVRFVKEGTITISVDTNNTISSNNDGVGNSPKEILINIKDSGQGIDSELLPRLFTKLTSKDGAAGNGLGFYICKNIVKSHGGRIWAENNKNEIGATFSFSSPLNF